MCIMSHTYCFIGPSALVLSAVVICCMIVNCEITNAANEYFRAPRAFCVFEHFPCGTKRFAV